MSLKIDFDSMPSGTTTFSLQGSWNRGRNWENLSALLIEQNYDEGYSNFLLTSSHVRFKITCTAAIAPYVISELVLKIRARGKENSLGVQTP